MYDIEGKLRRRAMLERLEGLGRAAEVASNAAPIPVPDQSSGPRHRNDPIAVAPEGDGLSPLHDDLSRQFRSAEPDADAVPEPVAAVAVPYLETDPSTVAADPYLEASPYASSGPLLRTAPYGFAAGSPPAPATNGWPHSVQQRQVAPLEPEAFEEVPLEVPVEDLPLDRVQSPALVQSQLHVPLQADGNDDAMVDDLAVEEAPAGLVSSAATIADLLRHGADRLFFAAGRPESTPNQKPPAQA